MSPQALPRSKKLTTVSEDVEVPEVGRYRPRGGLSVRTVTPTRQASCKRQAATKSP